MDAELAARIWSVDGCVPEDAVAIGSKAAKGRPVRKLSNKLIGAIVSSEAGKATAAAAAAAVSAAEVAGGVDDGEKHAADVAPAAAAEADDTSRKEGRLRLSEEYVKCILSLKQEFFVDPDEEYARMVNHPGKIYPQEFIEKTYEVYRDQAESSKRTFARFEKLQAWMRAELEEKGYVEVDDDYIAQRVLCRVAAEAGLDEWVDAFVSME
ncbi:hypothetical protein SEVIR_8G199400v4 [Setaria viridis]